MAIHRINSNKDATISSKPFLSGVGIYKNEGKDEVLEIGEYEDELLERREKRILINFPQQEILNILANITSSYSATLNLKHCWVRGEVYPRVFQISSISGSWTEGTGKKYNPVGVYGSTSQERWEEQGIQSTTGVTWVSRTGAADELWNTPGGDFHSSSVTSIYPVSEDELDFSINITSLLSGSLDGFLIQLQDTGSMDSYLHSFYGRNTHTIYEPYLEIGWRDQEWVTDRPSLPSSKDFSISLTPQLSTLYPDQEQTLYLNPRVKYPVRTFSTSSLYLQKYTLPSSSMWRIVEDETGVPLIDFHSEYTLVHSNENGNYMKFNTNILSPERYYRVEVKVEEGGVSKIVDTQTPFKLR